MKENEKMKTQFTLREIMAFGAGFAILTIACVYFLTTLITNRSPKNVSAATFDSQITPATSSPSALDIGSSSSKWRSIYLSQNMNIDGKVVWTNGVAAGATNNSISMLKAGSVPVTYAAFVAGTLQTITVASTTLNELAGILPGDRVFVTPPPALNDNLAFMGARAITDGIEVKLKDMRTSGSNLASAGNNWSYLVIR